MGCKLKAVYTLQNGWIPHNNVASVIIGKHANSTKLLLSISLKGIHKLSYNKVHLLTANKANQPQPKNADPCVTMSSIYMTVLSENVSSLSITIYESYKANNHIFSPCHCRFTLWMTQKYYSIYLQSPCPHI